MSFRKKISICSKDSCNCLVSINQKPNKLKFDAWYQLQLLGSNRLLKAKCPSVSIIHKEFGRRQCRIWKEGRHSNTIQSRPTAWSNSDLLTSYLTHCYLVQSGCLSCKNPSKSLRSESTNSSVANKNTIIGLLNFSTGDVLTTPNDNVFGSVKDVYKALLIHRTNVTRTKPQVSMIINMEDFCSLVWLSPVPVKTHLRRIECPKIRGSKSGADEFRNFPFAKNSMHPGYSCITVAPRKQISPTPPGGSFWLFSPKMQTSTFTTGSPQEVGRAGNSSAGITTLMASVSLLFKVEDCHRSKTKAHDSWNLQAFQTHLHLSIC